MNCMKCGRETADGQAFCDTCLEEMEHHPVKPGTVILLPTPPKQSPKKPPARKKAAIPPEEQIPVLKRRLWRLRFLALFLALAVAGLAYITSRVITELDIQRLLGQNYSTSSTQRTPQQPPVIITGR